MQSPFHLTNGGSLAGALEAMGDSVGFITLMLSRREIEAGKVGDAVDRLMVLSESTEYTRQFGNRLLVIVDGYNDDPRELHEIPACRSFFGNLTAAWPYWFHFVERESATESAFSVVMMLLLHIEVASRAGGVVSAAISPGSLVDVVGRLFTGMNALYDMHGFSEEEKLQTTFAVNSALDALFGGAEEQP